jgi:type I restriction enzyme S subunit
MTHPSYPSTRDSGLPWLGQIPAHWDVKRLKFIAPASTNKFSDKPDDLLYVGLENTESGTGRILMETQPESVESNVGIFEKGDILFGKLRPYLAKVVQANFHGSCTTEILALRPRPGFDGRFLFYHLLSSRFIDTVNSMTYGTKMPRASWEQIGNLALSIPPLPEQYTIAAFLDHQTAKIDTLIAKEQRLLELLTEQRSAIISQAVTKGLNPTVTLKDSGVPWLRNVPYHWEVKRLGMVSPLLRGHDLTTAEREEGDIPVISSSGPSGYHNRAKAKGPGVVTGRYGTTGKLYYVEQDFWPMNTALYVYDFKGNLPRYIYYLLQILPFDAYSRKSAVPGIDRNDLHPLLVCQPPLHEQEQIVAYIDQQTKHLDDLVGKVETIIERLCEYRSALISSAVTGKIRVRAE